MKKHEFASEEKNLFLEKFHAPAIAGAYLDIIFTEQEIRFVLAMDQETFTMEDIRKIMGDNAEEFVKNAYHRGILSYVAKEIVINSDKQGLMHTVNPTGICMAKCPKGALQLVLRN